MQNSVWGTLFYKRESLALKWLIHHRRKGTAASLFRLGFGSNLAFFSLSIACSDVAVSRRNWDFKEKGNVQKKVGEYHLCVSQCTIAELAWSCIIKWVSEITWIYLRTVLGSLLSFLHDTVFLHFATSHFLSHPSIWSYCVTIVQSPLPRPHV